MYQVGDLVIYGKTGVCKVIEVTTQEMEKQRLYYTLMPLYQSCTIFAPVNSTKVFMRPIVSKDEAERLVDMIPSIRAEAYHNQSVNQLAGHYEASLNTHDCAELITLTMSIHAKKKLMEQQKRKFGAVDERFMKCAEELLFGELAAALCISKDEVPEYIAKRVSGIWRDNNNEYHE